MRLPPQIFVTGTDTGIGKTVVSAMLMIGLKARYWKPIQSGTIDGTDTDWIKSVTNFPDDRFIPELYSLTQPLSPHAAAKLDGVEVSIDDICVPDSSPLIVEGAGGVMVPLNERELMIDLMKKLDLPIVVVARSGLGTINHTVLTLNALRANELDVCGVVMNGPRNPSNHAAIEKYADVEVLAEIPHIDLISLSQLQAIFDHQFGAVPA